MTREKLMDACRDALDQNPGMPVAAVKVAVPSLDAHGRLGFQHHGAWALFSGLERNDPAVLAVVDGWVRATEASAGFLRQTGVGV